MAKSTRHKIDADAADIWKLDVLTQPYRFRSSKRPVQHSVWPHSWWPRSTNVQPMVSGKLLPLYDATLCHRADCEVRSRLFSRQRIMINTSRRELTKKRNSINGKLNYFILLPFVKPKRFPLELKCNCGINSEWQRDNELKKGILLSQSEAFWNCIPLLLLSSHR